MCRSCCRWSRPRTQSPEPVLSAAFQGGGVCGQSVPPEPIKPQLIGSVWTRRIQQPALVVPQREALQEADKRTLLHPPPPPGPFINQQPPFIPDQIAGQEARLEVQNPNGGVLSCVVTCSLAAAPPPTEELEKLHQEESRLLWSSSQRPPSLPTCEQIT